jgi:uncharacterized protein YqhQ
MRYLVFALRFLGYLLLSLTTRDGSFDIPEVRVKSLSARKKKREREKKELPPKEGETPVEGKAAPPTDELGGTKEVAV